jgi:ABC-type polysaccharide/polyol phosphate transport system ATPase subunit
VLQVQNVSKVYRLYRHPSDQLKERIGLLWGTLHTEFWALKEISFIAERGEFLAVVGPNGCGKSTLLQIVSGILQPTTGEVALRGRIAALLELGAGFNPDFSGRENVLINGELLGVPRRDMESVLPRIEAFADIGAFINRPVKEYSSGMAVRLAFSTAIHVDPDVLIVDEALAVGDAAFANRCVRKFQELRERGVTVLFVSHDMGLVKQLSDRAIFLFNGEIAKIGDPKSVVDAYFARIRQEESQPEQEIAGAAPAPRPGDGTSHITSVELLDTSRVRCRTVESGSPVTVRVDCVFNHDAEDPQIGILIRTRIGMEVYGTNTRVEGLSLGSFEAGSELSIEFRFNCWLTPQQYSISVATQHADGASQDWFDDALVFDVVSKRHAAGVADLRAEVLWTTTPA